MHKITFVAPFPNEKNNRGGVAARVAAVDKLFEKDERVYLDISPFSNLRQTKSVFDKVVVYNLNFFLHTLTIVKLCLDSRIIYCHTLGRILRIIIPLLVYKKKFKLILDIHGTAPEEFFFQRKYLHALLFHLLEKYSFRLIDCMVGVTDVMISYYRSKYPYFKGEFLCYAILPKSILYPTNLDLGKLEDIKTKFSIEENHVVIIYSGSVHKWQNIDTMLDIIETNNYHNLKYFVCTGDIDLMKKKIAQRSSLNNNIILLSLPPDELSYYYHLSHYGFILRDDHILNRVACPTKLMEYLFYGITPIVDLVEIGDFNHQNYTFLKKENFNKTTLHNSKVQQNIIHETISKNDGYTFRNKILSGLS